MNRLWVAIALLACLAVSQGAVRAAEDLEDPMALDQPPKSRQVPYTPADGSTVSVNPPPFVWVPVAEEASYALQVSQSPDFSNGVLSLRNIQLNTATLPGILEPGTWYWRYGLMLGDNKVRFSKTRRFDVPEQAAIFRFPNTAAAVRQIPKQRPRLFFPADTLDEYRTRVERGDLTYLKDAFKKFDRYIGEELVAEPPPVRGSGAERGQNYAKIFRATRPPMDAMERLALSYVLTKNEAHGQEAKRRILHFFRWDPKGATAYRSNDEPAMWVMMRGVRAYDWTADLFTAPERREVEDCMRIRAAQFYDHLKNRRRFHTDPFESHAGRTLGFLGEAAICFAHEWPESQEWFDYVLTLFWNIYPAWGKDDGGWHEGPGYYTAYMNFALHYVTALKEATDIDLMQKPFFRNTPKYLLYTNPPYAKISPFGDGEHNPAGRSRGDVMYYFSTLLDDPYARWYAEQTNSTHRSGLLNIVLKNDAIPARSPAELPPTHYFPGVGLVSVHTALGNAAEDIHFLIHSDPYGPISHAHADQNAFTVEAFGEALAIASGYYPWYGSDHHRLWQWESKSSNTITFDSGVGQVVRSPESKGAITAYKPGDHYDYIEADATAAYQGRLTKCVRKVVHVKPGVFVMFDDCEAPDPVTFEWRLHALSEMTLEQEDQRIIVAQNDARMLVRLFHDENLVLEQTQGAEPPPERGDNDHYYVVASTPAKTNRLVMISVLMPFKNGEEFSLPVVRSVYSPTGYGVQIEDRDGLHTIGFRTDASAGTWGLGVLDSDGDVFAAHARSDSTYDKWLLHNGTRLVEDNPQGTKPVAGP